jgi:hypothetical protein
MNKSVHQVYIELCELWDNELFYNFLHPKYIEQQELVIAAHLSDPIGIVKTLKESYLNDKI